MERRLRRIASNSVYVNNKFLGRYVVEYDIESRIVKDYYPLFKELPFTEWLDEDVYIESTKALSTDNNLIIQKIDFKF